MPAPHRRILLLISLLLSTAAALTSCSRQPDPPGQPPITAELKSWVVLGWGRHLYLQIVAPPPHQHLSGRVEFTSAALRSGYDCPSDPSRAARLCRMTRGRHLHPFIADPQERIEARYTLTIEQARSLQRDRVFSAPYILLTTNSNAAMALALREASLALPGRVSAGGGIFGEFPGINLDPGSDISPDQWPAFGLQRPSVPTPQPS